MMGSKLPSGLGKPGLGLVPQEGQSSLPKSPPADLQLSLSYRTDPVVTSSSAAKSGTLGDLVLVPPFPAA